MINQNSQLIADPALKHEIEDILHSEFRFLRFPSYLEQHFLRSYHSLSLKNLHSNNLYLLGLYFLMGLMAFSQFTSADQQTFLYAYLITGIGLLTLNTCSRIRRMDRWFQWYSGITCMLILTAITSSSALMTQPSAISTMQAISIYSIIIIYAMAKMRFYSAVFWCHLAGGLQIIILNTLGHPPSQFIFQTFFMSANLIGMGITYIIEHRERTMFLQGLLLDIDKTEKDILNRDLEKLSREDSLTGLANRRYFDECLRIEWNRCQRENTPLSLILMDIDYFKYFNDCYGHISGDQCLIQIARALKQEASRPAELVGRYGGEEFILLYPSIDANQIKNTLLRIQKRINSLAIPHKASKTNHLVTASLGAATVHPVKSLSPEKLINAADQMLYKSKENGRNCWFNTQISHCEPQQQTLINFYPL